MKLVAPVVLALAVVLVATTPAEAAKRKPTCAAKGSKTVSQTRDVRVWSRAGTDEQGNESTDYWGCLKSVRRQVFLASSSGDGLSGGSRVRGLRVAGRYVAWESVIDAGCSRYQMCPPENSDGLTSRVVAFDLRRRRRVQQLTLADPATAFAVTQRGGLAILAGGSLLGLDAGGVRVLDTGAIAGRSLKAEISVVSWVRDGVERFARLR